MQEIYDVTDKTRPFPVNRAGLKKALPQVSLPKAITQEILDYACQAVFDEDGEQVKPECARKFAVIELPELPAGGPGESFSLKVRETTPGKWGAAWESHVHHPTPAEVRREGARRMMELVSEYEDEERETWATQVAQARLVLSGAAGNTSMVAQLAEARGITMAEMAAYVIAKSDMLADATGAVLAAQRLLIEKTPIPADFREDVHWP